MASTPLLSSLNQWQKITFCAALLERMLPNYQLFAQAVEFGEFSVLRNQLDLIWQWLDKNNRCKINVNAQLLKLEQETPDPEAFDSFAVFPALDTCMALMSLLQAMQDQDSDDVVNVSRLSQNSVSYYVELCLTHESDAEDVDISADDIAQDPLMQWENETQDALLGLIVNGAENKKTCDLARTMVLEQGLSSLGLEITTS
jgi:uncharacterized protein YjaG (DUF416 family)